MIFNTDTFSPSIKSAIDSTQVTKDRFIALKSQKSEIDSTQVSKSVVSQK